MSYSEEIVNQVDFFAKCEDSLFARHVYWGVENMVNRFYRINPFWKIFTEEEQEKVMSEVLNEADRYINQARALNRKYILKLPNITIDFLDVEQVNRFLPNGYLYDCSLDTLGKYTFLVGKKEEERKIKTKTLSVTSILLGEEILTNTQLGVCGFYCPICKMIVGRKRSALYSLWDRINYLKETWKEGSKEIFQLHGIEKLSGLRKQDILKSPGEEINEKIKKAAESCTKYIYMPHEEGHLLGEESFPNMKWTKWIILCQKNERAEEFIRAVLDVQADCIESGDIKGKFPSIFSLEEPIISGLLSLEVSDLYSSDPECRPTLERDIVIGFNDYLHTNDRGALKDANKKMLERQIQIAEKIHELDEKGKFNTKAILKLREKAEREYRTELPKIEETLEQIQNKIKIEI